MTVGAYVSAFQFSDDLRYYVLDDDEIYGVDISPSTLIVDENDVPTDINERCIAPKLRSTDSSRKLRLTTISMVYVSRNQRIRPQSRSVQVS